MWIYHFHPLFLICCVFCADVRQTGALCGPKMSYHLPQNYITVIILFCNLCNRFIDSVFFSFAVIQLCFSDYEKTRNNNNNNENNDTNRTNYLSIRWIVNNKNIPQIIGHKVQTESEFSEESQWLTQTVRSIYTVCSLEFVSRGNRVLYRTEHIVSLNDSLDSCFTEKNTAIHV